MNGDGNTFSDGVDIEAIKGLLEGKRTEVLQATGRAVLAQNCFSLTIGEGSGSGGSLDLEGVGGVERQELVEKVLDAYAHVMHRDLDKHTSSYTLRSRINKELSQLLNGSLDIPYIHHITLHTL